MDSNPNSGINLEVYFRSFGDFLVSYVNEFDTYKYYIIF